MKKMGLPLFALVLLVSCTSISKKSKNIQTAPDEVVLMTYNLENLFDTQDDPGKNDEEFLPRSLKKSVYYQNICYTKSSQRFRDECLGKDWSKKVFNRKVSRLADVISRVNDKKGPDVLVVEEVENRGALQSLAKAMPQFGYKTVELIEGPDERGIDVGVLSRLPKKSSKLHTIDFEEIKYSLKSKEDIVKKRAQSKDKDVVFELAREDVKDIKDNFPTRGILEVELELPDGQSLFVLGAHLPSQSSSSGYRRVVLEKLSQIKQSLPQEALVFAAGDFNISAGEEKAQRLFTEQASRDWKVSHLIGCKSCPGTYYYHRKREWSFFDVFLFEKEMTDGSASWQVSPESIHVFNGSLYQVNRFGSPARFGKGMKGVGVSDHWPLLATIRKTNQKGDQP